MAYTARDYMSRSLIRLSPDMEILQAIGILIENGISGGPVIDRLGNLVGMLSEWDCLEVEIQAGYHGSRGGKVRDFMCTEFEIVDVNDSVMDIVRLLRSSRQPCYRALPVLKNSRVVGNISLRDVLRALQDMAAERR